MIGRRINDRYRIISRVGDGGMSIVYKAEDLILDRLVAVKVLRGEYSSDEAFIRRFRREAEAVASLSDPNIVNIYDIGEEEDLYYIVMEYVDGLTLKSYIQQYAPIPPRDAIYILKQITSALQHAHLQGIVHRDVKPQNILIDNQDNVKVTDFGIALAVSSATITFTNSIMGSAHYLSPEQAKGRKATAKSDIYAFGIVMYEMLTGELPFPGESPVTVALKHLNESFTRPRDLNPNIPQSLENIILRSMEKSPDDRYDGMNEIYQALSTALDPDRLNEAPYNFNVNDPDETKIIPPLEEGIVSKEEVTAAAAPPLEETEKTPKKKEKKKRKKRVLIWSTVGLLILILLVSLIVFLPKLLFVPNVTVPNVENKTYDQAVNALTNKHLYVKKQNVENDQTPSGIVVNQSPVSGNSVKVNSTVILYVSSGPQKQEVPDFVGYDQSTVNQLLKGSQYKSVVWKKVSSDTIPSGQVLAQKPDPNTKIVPSETILELTVSTGPAKIQVPDVTSESQDSATSTLQQLGFNVQVADGDYSDSVPQGDVLSTNPSAGTAATKGDTITIYLSKGPQLKPVSITVPITIDVTPANNGNGSNQNNGNTNNSDNGNSIHVQITYTDANHQNAVFKDEEITQTTTYSLPMTINPNSYGSYQVIVNGTTVQQKTIQYSDVQSSSNGSG